MHPRPFFSIVVIRATNRLILIDSRRKWSEDGCSGRVFETLIPHFVYAAGLSQPHFGGEGLGEASVHWKSSEAVLELRFCEADWASRDSQDFQEIIKRPRNRECDGREPGRLGRRCRSRRPRGRVRSRLEPAWARLRSGFPERLRFPLELPPASSRLQG